MSRSGVLYRSGNLANLDADGLAAFDRLGVRRIIDLRDDAEVVSAPSRVGAPVVEVQRVPLFVGSVASLFAEDVPLTEMYRQLVDDSAPRIVSAVRGILAAQPVLVHCTVGKDRTGVTVAVALDAAGVEREAVIADYARTEALLPLQRHRDIVQRIRQYHPQSVHLEELATRSPAPAMAWLLERMDSQFGSPAEYLYAHGMSHDELSQLRRTLVSSTGASAE